MKKKTKKVVKYGTTEYWAVHYWLRKNHGSASICESNSCSGNSKRFHWALLKGCEYECNRNNFMQLCSSCHTKYDATPEGIKRSAAFRVGRKRPMIWRQCYASKRGETTTFPSQTECAAFFNVRPGQVNNALKRGYRLKGYAITYSV